MRSLLSGVGAVVGFLISLLVIAVLIGGYSYRKTCPTAAQGIERSWTFQIAAFLPYIFKPSETDCSVHSGTRVALSAIGLFKIKNETAGQIARQDAANATSPGRIYFDEVYAAMADMKAATANGISGLQQLVGIYSQADAKLHSITPPSYIANDNAQLLAFFDDGVSELKAAARAKANGNSFEARRRYAQMQKDLQKVSSLGNVIVQKIQQHASG